MLLVVQLDVHNVMEQDLLHVQHVMDLIIR